MANPNYRAFARDMMKLCKKHGVEMNAWHLGNVSLGPAKAKTGKDIPYSGFTFSPTEAHVGDGPGEKEFTMRGDDAQAEE